MDSKVRSRGRSWRIRSLLLAAALLAGCDASQVFTDKDLMWIWLLIPLFGIGLGGATLVWPLRAGRLRDWRLDEDPVDPGVRPLVLGVVGGTVILAILFIAANIQYGDGGQSYVNIGLWLLGSIGGGSGALLLGLSLAEPRKTNR